MFRQKNENAMKKTIAAALIALLSTFPAAAAEKKE